MVSQLSSNEWNSTGNAASVPLTAERAYQPVQQRPDGWFERRCILSAERIALKDEANDTAYTFRELNEHIDRAVKSMIRLGIRAGDRVGMISPNDSGILIALFACRRLGAILVPLNWRLHVEELKHIMADCTPSVMFYHDSTSELADKLQEENACSWLALDALGCMEVRHSVTHKQKRDSEFEFNAKSDGGAAREDDTDAAWVMIYTGGTTGKPKGVVLTVRSIYWNALNTVATWQLTEADVTPTVLPMFHTGGLNALTLPVLMSGGTVICVASFDPNRIVQLLERERCTIVLMVPTMYHQMVQCDSFQRTEFSAIRAFLSGGAPCPLSIYDAFLARSLPFKEGYGATESGPNNFYITPENAFKKRGSVGMPMLFNDVCLFGEKGEIKEPDQVGELALRGRHLFQCYWNNEEATVEVMREGWFLTGDLAKRDAEGYYYIVGRKKDMIITGGENVYPLEIEHILEQHPAVSAAAVVGLPDPKWGEIVAAGIVLHHDAALPIEELTAFCSQYLAKYKVPKRMRVLEELPKTAVGKLDKKALAPLLSTE